MTASTTSSVSPPATLYLLLQLARHAASGPTWMASLDAAAVAGIPTDTRELLQRVAFTVSAFDSDEFVALTGLPDTEAFEHLDRAIVLGVLEPATIGYRFRHRLVREALLRYVPPHRLRRIHRDAADRLSSAASSPARIAHHLVLGRRRPRVPSPTSSRRPRRRRHSVRIVTCRR